LFGTVLQRPQYGETPQHNNPGADSFQLEIRLNDILKLQFLALTKQV
jgi:hypothetical protein